jgi:uncharacterized protein
MNRLAATIAVALTAAFAALPAAARDTFVQDNAGMFSQSAIAQVNQRIGAFNQATGKEIVVVTVPSLQGQTLQDAAQKAFTQQNVNGVLVFIARDDRRDIIVPDRAGAQAGWFSPDVLRSIRTGMESAFRSGDYDSGLSSAVDGILGVYRQHAGSRSGSTGGQIVPSSSGRLPATSGIHISMFWWIVIIVVGFLILRSIMRAASAPRYYGGPPGAPGAPGAPGYGPGYGGYGGGGGSFWSGLLGGLGGAFLGNEMFGNRGGGGGGAIGSADASQAPDAGGGWGGGADAGGWQSDAGQADMGGSSGGDWSGGGFGGGDFGGGGGGGGDSGGGW